jgi:hypothetical protein
MVKGKIAIELGLAGALGLKDTPNWVGSQDKIARA